MTEIRSLTSFSEADLRRCATGYVTNKRYEVSYADSEESTAFQLMVIELDKPL